ncbi:hypothetical protein [Pseudobacteriovorax antillogorgiicola]|uniref:Uncharacterized protein n=1 Tax=Pseudobacteriovorax antillogorgiicola TaxID=1513793 RepID=A0A1Y6BJ55_9BACT|nr:hypothetical protein [Pseudobacteriovorax antillogorgiicola]TCS56419.1 hypothetical protein EDD56_104241 [Pseudobacteriovorax antillogorgiicola]SMF05745.1 hypothetical protein SAMN06296036_10492 [Pseudobacteriovorax antillogorgiicola]
MTNPNQHDFEQFMSSDTNPPATIKKTVLNDIRRDQKLFPWRCHGKFVCIHAMAASLTLLICPQFGLGGQSFVMDFLHRIAQHNPWLCALICSGIFFFISTTSSVLAMREYELRVIEQFHLRSFSIYTLAIGALMMVMGTQGSSAHQEMFFSSVFIVMWLMSGYLVMLACFHLVKTISFPSKTESKG